MCLIGFGGMDGLSFRPFRLLRRSALALACLGFITGARGLRRRLSIGCICAAWVPVAPAMGAAPLNLCLVPRWHRMQCDASVVCWLMPFQRPGWGFAARVALLACVGGLSFVVCAFGGFPL